MVWLERQRAWAFLKVTAVLAIAAGIVWWTMPGKPKPSEGAGGPADKEEPPRN